MQRFLRQHGIHLPAGERLAVDVGDLVAHLQARSGSGGPFLDLRDDVAVVEITAHLRGRRFALGRGLGGRMGQRVIVP